MVSAAACAGRAGSSRAATHIGNSGDSGLCQEVTIPCGGALTFWVYEGTTETSTKYAYQEAALLSGDARSSTLVAKLVKEVTTTDAWCSAAMT
jgi:hypothetical protein